MRFTHDVPALTGFGPERVGADLSMPAHSEAVASAPRGKAAENLALSRE